MARCLPREHPEVPWAPNRQAVAESLSSATRKVSVAYNSVPNAPLVWTVVLEQGSTNFSGYGDTRLVAPRQALLMPPPLASWHTEAAA